MGSSGPGFIFLLDDVASHDRKTHSQLKDIVYLWKTYKALVIELGQDLADDLVKRAREADPSFSGKACRLHPQFPKREETCVRNILIIWASILGSVNICYIHVHILYTSIHIYIYIHIYISLSLSLSLRVLEC